MLPYLLYMLCWYYFTQKHLELEIKENSLICILKFLTSFCLHRVTAGRPWPAAIYRGVHRGGGHWGHAPPKTFSVIRVWERESTTEIGKERVFVVNWAFYLASAKVLIIIYVPWGGKTCSGGAKPPKKISRFARKTKTKLRTVLSKDIFKKCPPWTKSCVRPWLSIWLSN